MAYVAPSTQSNGDTISATEWNILVNDIIALKSPPGDDYIMNEAGDKTVSSAAGWTDIDGTNWSFSITTAGDTVLVGFYGSLTLNTGSGRVYFDVTVGGARQGGDDGLLLTFLDQANKPEQVSVAFTYMLTGLTPGANTIALQWKTSSANTVTLYAGAGTSNADVHPQFWVREIG